MAAAAARDLALLAATARRSIGDLRHAVRGARAQDGRRGTRFLDLIDAALDALAQRVDEAERMAAAATDEKEHRAAARFARRINYDLRLLHEAAPWVESARQGTLGLGLVYFIDEMVAGLLREPADVVMAPTATYMYSTVYNISKWLESALSFAVTDGPIAIVVAYPAHEPDSLFLHLLVAHELAHSVVPAEGLIAKVQRKDPDNAVTGQALATAAQQYHATHGGTEREARLHVATILRDWLTELLCDALSLAFLGPSFLFTFVAFSTPFEQTAQESHPPFTIRTEILSSHLTSAGWEEVSRAIAPATVGWILNTSSAAPDALHPYFEPLQEGLRHLAPAVTEVAREHVADMLFVYNGDEVLELKRLLERDILPAQVGKEPASRRSIILAGWMHAFMKHPDAPASLAAITADRDHQRFLTKALEMSIVLQTWMGLP